MISLEESSQEMKRESKDFTSPNCKEIGLARIEWISSRTFLHQTFICTVVITIQKRLMKIYLKKLETVKALITPQTTSLAGGSSLEKWIGKT